MDEYDVVLWIGTGVLALVAPPAFWLLIDYCIITPLHRLHAEKGLPDEERVYIPWWRNGVGIVWAALIFSIVLFVSFVDISRFISLHDGSNWPGREWISLGVYGVILLSMLLAAFVYAVEKQTPALILVSRRRRKIERARQAEMARSSSGPLG